ncbi:hypothetical protein LD11_gp006 [Bacillus phage Riley]|uniref:Uncharacterized protein n=2 Tax=Bequatrovirus riley TaxID=1918007 RepID=A0A075LZK5_9CAUD|nr:hypothetical protein LD11_gp006 [Bacillus phage Riley]AIF71882.1 hypothetical protein [Bacillus phage Riley]ASZ75740.1 hypothetical protein TAFFO16_7 [Bacillus phage Taffo16]ULF48628.1 hypothetical protein [Bacillus phage BillyBob]
MEEVNLKHRYWVFDIPEFYPTGGLSDITYTTDSVVSALVKVEDDPDLILFDSITRLYYWEEDDEWR